MTTGALLQFLHSLPPDNTIEPRALAAVLVTSPPGTSRDALIASARAQSAAMRRSGDFDEVRDRPLARPRTRDVVLRARASELSAALRPHVLRWRERLLGSGNVPMRGLHQAETWLLVTAGPPPPSDDFIIAADDAEALSALKDRVQSRRAWIGMTGPSTSACFVHYFAGDGGAGSAYVRRGSILAELGWWCQRVERQTGLSERSLVAAVLCDIWPGQRVTLSDGTRGTAPGLSLVEVARHGEGPRWHDMPELRRTLVTLTIDERDISDRAFREIRQHLTRGRRAAAEKRPTRRQAAIAEQVAIQGGAPQPYFQRAFWEAVCKRLPAASRPTDWRAIARAYRRIGS